jgi:hypothetical protein
MSRRERDLNPRDPCGPTRFRGGRTRPDYAIPPEAHRTRCDERSGGYASGTDGGNRTHGRHGRTGPAAGAAPHWATAPPDAGCNGGCGVQWGVRGAVLRPPTPHWRRRATGRGHIAARLEPGSLRARPGSSAALARLWLDPGAALGRSGSGARQGRRARKNARSCSAQACSSTPRTTSTRWLSRGSRGMS